MKLFFIATFDNGYKVAVNELSENESSCQFCLVPQYSNGEPHKVVPAADCKAEMLAATLDYLQMQMEVIDNPPRIIEDACVEEIMVELVKKL